MEILINYISIYIILVGDIVNNKINGAKLAKYYNRKYGIITYSGTLAIEYSLKSMNFPNNSNILVLSTVCSSIINTIKKCNLNPVIVEPMNGYSLTNMDIEFVLSKYNIACILLVHQFGMMNNIDIKKYKEIGIKIIEDVSQIFINDEIVKSNSDIIVTSFGITKPLSYGIGGALLFNDQKYFELSDYCDNESRKSKSILLSYLYPKDINIKKLVRKAYKNIMKQKKIAKEYCQIINDSGFAKINYDKASSYHRFILKFDEKNISTYNKLITIIKNSKLKYQLEHDIELIRLPICENVIVESNSKYKYKYIFLRTRNINFKQKKILCKTIKNIDSMI